MTGIYSIVNLHNGKVYIGQSKHIKKRWAEHKDNLQKGTHCNRHLQKAWNKYGENNFVFCVLEQCSQSELTEREQYWIDYYGGINCNNNYNFKDAGSGGQMSEVTRRKMSENTLRLRQDPEWVKKNSEAIKRSWTPERRKHMSEIKTGTKWTETQRQNRKKYDDARRGVPRPEVGRKVSATLKGHKVSEETREKLRQAGLNQVHHKRTAEQIERIREGAKKGWETRRKHQAEKSTITEMEEV